MPDRFGRWTMMLGAAASAFGAAPVAASAATPAYAQSWSGDRSCRGREGRDRIRCERDRDRRDRERERRERERRERERRNDARTDGVIAGVIGTAILGGIIVAATSGNKKNPERDRRAYCEDRYGNYDPRTDSYRASDGRWYRCR